MNTNKRWHDSEIQEVIELWKDGVTIFEIANQLDRTEDQVRMWMFRNRDKYGLSPRQNIFVKKKQESDSKVSDYESEFEKEWKGPIPFGHWSITKPWKLT